MANRKLWLGILVIVFGIMVVGCISLIEQQLAERSQNLDGKGGIINIQNASDNTDYWYYVSDGTEWNSGYSSTGDRQSPGVYTPKVWSLPCNSVNGRHTYRDNCKVTVGYKRKSQGEWETPSFYSGGWSRKTITVSDGETFWVNIP